jgi:hypothetical protein
MTVRRVASFTALFVVGPLVASASCSSATTPNAATPSRDAAVASIDAADAATAAAACPVSAALAARCTGTDPSFTFFPPLFAADASSTSVPYTNTSYFSSAACAAFVDAQASGSVVVGATVNAPTWDFPGDGDVFPPDDWIAFEWEKGPTARNWLADALESTAHATPTTSGDSYVLVFTQGCAEIARVMLTDLYWVPDPPTWARLVAAVGPITATVTWVSFNADAIAQPPVASAPVTFRIVPDAEQDAGADAGDDSIDAPSSDAGDEDDASDAASTAD